MRKEVVWKTEYKVGGGGGGVGEGAQRETTGQRQEK